MSRAYASAAHIGALACIAAALAMVTVVQAEMPALVLWPAIIAMVPMVFALVMLDRHRTFFFSIAYVVVGGACVYWFALTALSQYTPLTATDGFVLTLPRIALMLVGGVGGAFISGIVWSAIGLAAAEIAIVLAALQVGTVSIVVDGTSLVIFALGCVILLLLQYGQRWVIAVQPSLHRAARDEELASVRYGIEMKAAAVMHDTVLGHLAAIASAPAGKLGSTLQAEVERDLEVLIGEEWLAEPSSTVDVQARAGWQQSALFAAIRESRALGLEIEVTGDIAAASRLDNARARPLALAVKQCLVNVLRHSGTRRAEVVIFGSDSELSVMIIDSGRGFSESETDETRLGLRQSVRKRMELAGGSVTVWSTLGRGTSVMIRVPTVEQSTGVSA